MADPLLDEGFLLQALNAPASYEMVQRLQSSSLMATVDGFDRKIQRDPFMRLAATAFSLHTDLGRFHILDRVKKLHEQEKLTQSELNEAHIQLLAFCEASRVGLINQVNLMVQCPTSEDKVS